MTAIGSSHHFLLIVHVVLFVLLALAVFGLPLLSYAEANRTTGGSTSATLIPGSTPAEDQEQRRRRAAKQWNERLKLVANFFNGLGIALFVANAITLPNSTDSLKGQALVIALLSAGTLLIIGLLVLSAWKSED